MSQQKKTLMVKAKAMYHIADLNRTIRRGEVANISEEDANRSNDLWRGQNFGLLEVKWVFTGDVAPVPVPKPKSLVVQSKQQMSAPAVESPKQVVSPDDIRLINGALQSLRNDLTELTHHSQRAISELKDEIGNLESKLAELDDAKKPPAEDKPKRGPKSKETGDAGVE